MIDEKNGFKQRNFPKIIVPFYKQAVEIGSKIMDMTKVNENIKKLEEFMTSWWMTKIKHEPPTMYKNNSRDSSKFKCCSPLQLSCNLTGKCHVVGYIFLYQR